MSFVSLHCVLSFELLTVSQLVVSEFIRIMHITGISQATGLASATEDWHCRFLGDERFQ
jgi:hypothetical protein